MREDMIHALNETDRTTRELHEAQLARSEANEELTRLVIQVGWHHCLTVNVNRVRREVHSWRD